MVFHSALKSSKKCNFWEDAFFCFYFDYLRGNHFVYGGSPVNNFAIVLVYFLILDHYVHA